MKNALDKLLPRFAAAGMLLTILFAMLFIFSNGNLFEFVGVARSWWIWGLIFGYGIMCSIIIDWIFRDSKKPVLKLLVYVLVGGAFFLLYGFTAFAIIASVVGMLSALVFYGALYVVERSKPALYTFGLFMPLFFLIFIQFDYTEKIGWDETAGDNSVHITVVELSGEHKIPVELKAGDTITFKTDFGDMSGAYGTSFVGDGEIVSMAPLNDYEIEATVEDAGVYYITLWGNDFSGTIDVSWVIEQN